MAQALTPAIVASTYCPPDRAQLDVFDSVVPGLALRVGRAGKKTWTLLYRTNGQRKRVSLGDAALMSLADARTGARQVLGGRVIPGPRAAGQTFDSLTELFFQRARLRPRTETEYRRIIQNELMPAWRTRLVATLTRDDIWKVLDPIIRRGAPVMANRVHQVIVAMMNLGIDRGWIQSNVASGIRKPGGKEPARERTLTLSEAAQFWLAVQHERPVTAAALRFALLTGQRKSEVMGCRWPEIDLGAGLWTIPAERAKNKREHTIPLSPTALAIIQEQNPYRYITEVRILHIRSGVVFPGAHHNLAPIMKRICERAGLAHTTIHDLRRTAATLMATAGTPRIVLKLILNHADNEVTGRYDRNLYEREKADAMNKLDKLVADEVAKINVSFPPTENR